MKNAKRITIMVKGKLRNYIYMDVIPRAGEIIFWKTQSTGGVEFKVDKVEYTIVSNEPDSETDVELHGTIVGLKITK